MTPCLCLNASIMGRKDPAAQLAAAERVGPKLSPEWLEPDGRFRRCPGDGGGAARGLSPIAALTAATATPTRRFGLTDRGRIAAGARADLVLVAGDPTTNIRDSLSVKEVWRRGVRQPRS